MSGHQHLAADAWRLAALRPLLGELMDLKRLRTPDHPEGLAAHGFRRAWAALMAGEAPGPVALRETARAVVAIRLGGVDSRVLRRAGMPPDQVARTLRKGLDAASGPLEPGLRERLALSLTEQETAERGTPPEFVEKLVRQPRAGATSPGHPRLLLEPRESHADHCYTVAVMAVLVSPLFKANPALPFLAGLGHHLHNAELPDAGDAGEALLGDAFGPLVRRLVERTLESLPAGLAALVSAARELLPHVDSPEARAFHAANVLDRVLELDFHARAAAFTLHHAMEESQLVQEGPLKAYAQAVLSAAGVWP